MTIKYYELLKVKEIETGSGYSKGPTVDEKTVKKSTNLEKLIEELEDKYQGEEEWIIIPKYLISELVVEAHGSCMMGTPYRYQKDDYVIVKSELKDEDMIEGVDYLYGSTL